MVGAYITQPGENAMSTVCRFLAKFASLILATLECFDRVLFKGYLPLARATELERFVDYGLGVRRCDFINVLAPQFSNALVAHAQRWARKANRTFLYRADSFRKDQWAEKIMREQRIDRGLVGILCTMETCNSFSLAFGTPRPRFVSKPRRQRVLYYYFLDEQLGLIHVRLQTWAPYTFQVYVNGHDWLAQQMARLQMGFVLEHNAFTQLDEPAKAQRLADRFAALDWNKTLNRYARLVNPLLRRELACQQPNWFVDQAEFATDLLFHSRAALSGLYQKLLQFAALTFTPKDIYGFLGRKYNRCFDGELQTETKTDRLVGTRVKHRIKRNWLKMYDKFGLVLRIETVINCPKDFAVLRTCHHRDGSASQGYFPMRKNIASLVHYQEHAHACNRRYLDALAIVDDPAPAYQKLRELTEPKKVRGRSFAGFNPARREDVRAFAAVLDGDGIPRGFRNQDIRATLFGPAPNAHSSHAGKTRRKTRQPQNAEQRRQSAAVGRLLKRMHHRHWLAKIPRTRRWRVTDTGRRLLSLAIQHYAQTWPKLASIS
jgi:hypothetical protein